MRLLIMLFFVIMAVGCRQSIDKEELNLINGYWEIEKVAFPDGSEKEYRVSTTVDYFFYEDSGGYRKKVQPKLDGSFMTSDDAEYFKIASKNNTFIIQYDNELSRWEEELIRLDTERLILRNQEGIKYHYKKFQSISVK